MKYFLLAVLVILMLQHIRFICLCAACYMKWLRITLYCASASDSGTHLCGLSVFCLITFVLHAQTVWWIKFHSAGTPKTRCVRWGPWEILGIKTCSCLRKVMIRNSPCGSWSYQIALVLVIYWATSLFDLDFCWDFRWA